VAPHLKSANNVFVPAGRQLAGGFPLPVSSTDLNSTDLKESRLSIIFPLRACVTAVAISVLALGAAVAQDQSSETPWRHGMSLFGDLKYAPGFKHFDYVNPDAPKGGAVRMTGIGTYDNFNPVVSGVKGTTALAIDLIYDTLMVTSFDEVTSSYGLLAESVTYPDDYSSVTYRLRPTAKWHDGEPVTPEDVIFSFNAVKDNNPRYGAYYQHVVKAEKTGAHDITFTFDMPGNRELPQIVGEINVLPKHWFEGTDKAGNKRNVANTTLEPPLGNGAYRIKEFVPGRSVVYERVKDYWGKDLPVNIGRDNFDEIRYEYYRDTLVALEAFKADQIDYRIENSAKNWATAYDFPAVKDKRIILEEFPILRSGGMQAFVFNIRRAKFADPLVRRAFNLVFDFEEINKQIFFGQYHRIASYFEGTELASSGLPSGRELEILETVRDQVPSEVFAAEYKNPVNGTPDAVRSNLREAMRLLREAGYEVRNQKLVNAKTGEPMTIEFLNDDPTGERLALFYKPALERLGIAVTVRTIDDAQYEYRERNWDYDVITAVWGESLSPGNEQRDFWGSKAADQPGSRNLIGIKNPAVDKLIDRVIFAKDRDDLVAATHALDRVLLWNHYVVPQWTYGKVRTARWDRFSHPEQLPKYGAGAFPTVWWWDPAKAAKTGGRQ
jgi:microcin C transport system substrate-binding protein